MVIPSSYTLDLVTIGTDTYPKTWSKPLTEVSFEVWSDTITKTHLLVMVTEVHLCTCTDTDEPVCTEAIGFDAILVSILHFNRIYGVSGLLSLQHRASEEASYCSYESFSNHNLLYYRVFIDRPMDH